MVSVLASFSDDTSSNPADIGLRLRVSGTLGRASLLQTKEIFIQVHFLFIEPLENTKLKKKN